MDTDRLDLAYLGDPNSIHLRRWAGWFADAGHRVHLLVPVGTDIRPGLHPAIDVEAFRPYGRGRGPLRGAVGARRTIRRILRRLRPDVLHAHYLTTAGWHAWLAGWHPMVVTVWGSDVYRNAHRGLGPLQARLVLGGADLVTADSEDLARAAVAAGAHAARVRVVQFGVDMRRFSPDCDASALRAVLGLGSQRVIFAPRILAPLYRQEVVLDALAGLPADTVAVFTRYAAPEGEPERMVRRAASLGLGGRVRILDAVGYDAMPEHHALADVLVSVPESDATPVTLLEAMAVGRPVVATDLPSVRALLEPVDPGALVPVGDVEATRGAIAERLGWSAARRAEHAERARARVRAIADQDENMRLVEGLYEGLARHPRRGAAAGSRPDGSGRP